MAKAVWSIKETAPGVWRCTINGRVPGDSRGFDKQGAIREAKEVCARDPEYKVYADPHYCFCNVCGRVFE